MYTTYCRLYGNELINELDFAKFIFNNIQNTKYNIIEKIIACRKIGWQLYQDLEKIRFKQENAPPRKHEENP